MREDGKMSARADENLDTKSDTANVDPSFVDKMPMINPPIVKVPVMKYKGLRVVNLLSNKLGKLFHNRLVDRPNIRPYKWPMAAVTQPTAIEAGISRSFFCEDTPSPTEADSLVVIDK